MSSRLCTLCGEVKPHYEDVYSRCIECRLKISREYYAKNREQVIARVAAYDSLHRPHKTKRKPCL